MNRILKSKKVSQDIQNIQIYTNLKHIYICGCRVNHLLIVINLYSVSIIKILARKFITVKYVNTWTSTTNLVHLFQNKLRNMRNSENISYIALVTTT